ncbi:MAG: porin, partial [Nitrospirae bacterium]|nr:porin [Nitrospirota bacterium]
VTVSPISGLKVGASYYTGKHGTDSEDHKTWGLSAEYDVYFLSLRGEYAAVPMVDHTQTGWYAEGSFGVGHLFPFVRYEAFDPNDTVANDPWTEWVTGVAYQFHPGVLLKAEYRQFGGNPGNVKVQEDYNEWASAFTMAF